MLADILLAEVTRQIFATQQITVKALALLAEQKDPDISGHLDRIKVYSRLLAETLAEFPAYQESLDRDFIDGVAETSLLHDVGKMGISEGILFKPGRLTPEEFQVMQSHTVIGGDVLGTADRRLRDTLGADQAFMTAAAAIARHHHERWDGQGYPDGLKGAEIPLAARLVAVADVYDALTSNRVYKTAWSHAHSRQFIFDGAGKHFDPDVVRAFMDRQKEFEAVRRQHEQAREGVR